MSNALIIILPTHHDKNEQKIAWWRVENDAIIESGHDINVLNDNDAFYSDIYDKIMAIAPVSNIMFRWHKFDGLPIKQAMTAAKIEALEQSIEKEGLFIAAGHSDGPVSDGPVSDGPVSDAPVSDDIDQKDDIIITSASIKSIEIENALSVLASYGIDPDIIIPSGLLLPNIKQDIDSENIAYRGTFHGETFIRSDEAIFIDEPALYDMLVGEKAIIDLSEDDINNAMLDRLKNPIINMRQGIFAKSKKHLQIDNKQKLILVFMGAAILIMTVMIGISKYARYNFAADNLKRQSLQLASSVNIQANDIESAEKALNQNLAERGLGAYQWSVPTSALFLSIQDTPNVSLRELAYNADGLLVATLAAPRNEDINPVLLSLQAKGYKITATTRTDASGFAVADITVRS